MGCVVSWMGLRASATTFGSTPARSSLTALTASPTTRSSARMAAKPETFDPRYSALPESTAASKNNGPTSAMIQNQRRRTRSTNSRRTTAQTLRIGPPPLCVRGIRTDQVDEDLVERRLLQLEARESRARLDQRREDPLCVCVGRELELGVLTVVIDLAHERAIGEHVRGTPGLAVEPDDQMMPPVRALDVA